MIGGKFLCRNVFYQESCSGMFGCAKNSPTAPKAGGSDRGSICVAMDVFSNISSGKVTVTNGPLSFTSNLIFSANNETASVTFTDLQVGNWNVTAYLYDATQTMKFYTEGSATVYAYKPTELVLAPIRTGGQLKVSLTVIGINDIIYNSNRCGHSQLFYLDKNGAEKTLSNSDYIEQVSNARYGSNSYFGIYRNGSSIQLVSFTINPARDGITYNTLLDNSHGENWNWVRASFDGTKIAFAHIGNTPKAYSIGVCTVSNGVLVNWDYLPNNGGYENYPVWTADGRIIYERYDSSQGANWLYVMNADGTNKTVISTSLGSCGYPIDCSVSNQILYFANGIYRINIDGSGYTSLTPGITARDARFRNDDQIITFWNQDTNTIYTMNNDSTGSGKTQASPGSYTCYYPCFMY